jgi:acetyl esterase/lipase
MVANVGADALKHVKTQVAASRSGGIIIAIPSRVAMIRTVRHVISLLFRPAIDALWRGRHLSWSLRWRLLAYQPLSVLINILFITAPYVFSRPFEVHYIPIAAGRELRVLVYKKPHPSDRTGSDRASLRPLHVDCHAGGFIGGYPESNAPWCDLVAQRTGAVVISLSYRLAPVDPFPAAPDDVDAAIAWLQANAASRYGADPKLMTVSGASAGGTLALAATQAPACHAPAETAIKGAVTFYGPVDMRPAPWEKPKLEGFEWDPLAFMQPLYDSYAAPTKATMGDSPRMNPCLATLETLPPKMLFVVPRMDILPKEILEFVERLQKESEAKGEENRKIEYLWLEDLFHGFLEGTKTFPSISKRKNTD